MRQSVIDAVVEFMTGVLMAIAFFLMLAIYGAVSAKAQDVSPSKTIQTLVNDVAVGCALARDSNDPHCKRAMALRQHPLTPDELMCIHKFANAARREAYDAAKYSVDVIFMGAALSGKCAVR